MDCETFTQELKKFIEQSKYNKKIISKDYLEITKKIEKIAVQTD